MKVLVNAVKINAITFTFDTGDTTGNKSSHEKEFNEYAKNNNLNIEIELEVMKIGNPTDSYTNFKPIIESSLKKSNSINSNNNSNNNNCIWSY